MNLKPKNKEHLISEKQKNFTAIYLALVIVVAINFLVFSYLLKDREQARAFLGADFSNFFTIFSSRNVPVGSNDVLVAEMITPDSLFNPAAACNFYLGSSCLTMVDADGAYSIGAGADDDGADNLLQIVPRPGTIMDAAFASGIDNVCADASVPPIEDVYVDGGDGAGGFDCIPGNDGVDKIILDDSNNGLIAAGYIDVSSTGGSIYWFHSELVNNNIAYDYCDPAVTPACGVSAAAAEAATETIWILQFVATDSVLKTAVSGGYWGGPYPNQWQGDGFASWIPGLENFTDINANGALNTGEAIIIDNDSDGLVTSEVDLLIDGDGTGSTLLAGSDDDALAAGAALTALTVADKVCINNLGGTGIPISAMPIIAYVDGTGDCIPGNGGTDQLIRDDTATGLPGIIAGLGAYPYTFFTAANILVYSDTLVANGSWDFGISSAATESLWLEHSGWGKWNTAAEGAGVHSWSLVDADGTETMGTGADNDGLIDNDALSYLVAAHNVCFSVVNGGGLLEDVYIDTSGDCVPQNDVECVGGMPCVHPNLIIDKTGDGLNTLTTFDAPVGQWVSGAGVFAFHDVFIPYFYEWGIDAGVTESLWTEIITPRKYSSSADDYLWNFTGLFPPSRVAPPFNFVLTDLSAAVGPAGFPLQYVDADSSGNLDEHDAILEDNGVFMGPAPNGVIDRMGDYVNRLTLKNIGTAQPNSDYTMQACILGYGDTWCAAPTTCVDMTWNGTGWETTGAGLVISLINARSCFFADISQTATPGATIQLQLPKLVDTGATIGLFDVGEDGFFLYSGNDGPTDAAYTSPYVYTIYRPSYGSVTQDYTPPGMVANVVIRADSSGKVAFTWQDPADSDLAKIVIDETGDGQTRTSEVNAGIQTLVLENREPGKVYTYKLRSQDTNGNLSLASVYTITVPATGEVTVSNPELFPAPIVPAPTVPETLILRGSEPAAPLPIEVSVGTLVKRSDMSAVYFIDEDNRRHTFPNIETYSSWYTDFSGVQTISAATLSAIPLGSNVTMRPGTYLLKIQSDTKVYAVEPYGVIRWVKTEEIAAELFGANWSTRIADVEPTFFVNYQLGSDITAAVHPSGSVIQYVGSNDKFYIDSGIKKLISEAVFSSNLFQDKFVAKNIPTAISYSAGADLAAIPISTLMTLR